MRRLSLAWSGQTPFRFLLPRPRSAAPHACALNRPSPHQPPHHAAAPPCVAAAGAAQRPARFAGEPAPAGDLPRLRPLRAGVQHATRRGGRPCTCGRSPLAVALGCSHWTGRLVWKEGWSHWTGREGAVDGRQSGRRFPPIHGALDFSIVLSLVVARGWSVPRKRTGHSTGRQRPLASHRPMAPASVRLRTFGPCRRYAPAT